MWEDVKGARALCEFDAVCCIKRAGIEWPEDFHIWAGLHPEFMADYTARRRAKGLPCGFENAAPPDSELGDAGKRAKNIQHRISYRWPGMNASAGSGIYGAKVMMHLGYRVVLAGVPMDFQPHAMPHEKWGQGQWLGRDGFMKGFEIATRHLLGHCKSMSGVTRDVLGVPTPDWLRAGRPGSYRQADPS